MDLQAARLFLRSLLAKTTAGSSNAGTIDPMPLPSAEVTTLLKAWRGGDERALERLTPLVYEHLRKLGRQYVRKEPPQLGSMRLR